MSSVRVTHRYMHPVDRVFEAWLNPAMASRFFFATRTGSVLQCEIEAEPGGSFVVTDRRPHADADESFFDAEHRGTYAEIVPNNRIVFDFTVGPMGAPTRVTLDFVRLGSAISEIVLEHELGEEADPHAASRARQGWERMLDQLEKVLGTRLRLG
ncbi:MULTISPECIES: SRPBCC family protein [Ramlibacter]|uniref:SRPBCC domain-containing protein n=1 Tax=Ramlibacter aquaticus TaxID=2780094 RepID=A0ABR9SGI2_9BURK|nr:MULTISPECIES: SRPBCC family protein [Ramlibacter]MBE7940999.1 SRPBCC domain-containing protein [Ramlibacter aquaticus]